MIIEQMEEDLSYIKTQIKQTDGQLKETVDGSNDDYDAHPCAFCINLCYFNWIKCDSCSKEYCLKHGIVCDCQYKEAPQLNFV